MITQIVIISILITFCCFLLQLLQYVAGLTQNTGLLLKRIDPTRTVSLRMNSKSILKIVMRLLSLHFFETGNSLREHLSHCLLEDIVLQQGCDSLIDQLVF